MGHSCFAIVTPHVISGYIAHFEKNLSLYILRNNPWKFERILIEIGDCMDTWRSENTPENETQITEKLALKVECLHCYSSLQRNPNKQTKTNSRIGFDITDSIKTKKRKIDILLPSQAFRPDISKWENVRYRRLWHGASHFLNFIIARLNSNNVIALFLHGAFQLFYVSCFLNVSFETLLSFHFILLNYNCPFNLCNYNFHRNKKTEKILHIMWST